MKAQILLIVLLFLSCQKELKIQQPDNLISQPEMTNILYDMFVISSSKGSSIDILKDNGIQPDAFVLNKYGIDSLQFRKSNDYYAHNIETYTAILSAVQERLEAEKAELEAQIEKEQEDKIRKSDSLIKSADPRSNNSERLNPLKKIDSVR